MGPWNSTEKGAFLNNLEEGKSIPFNQMHKDKPKILTLEMPPLDSFLSKTVLSNRTFFGPGNVDLLCPIWKPPATRDQCDLRWG